MTARPTASDDQPELDGAFTEYLLRIDRGEIIDRAKFLGENQEQAEELRELMEVDDIMVRLYKYADRSDSEGPEREN